MTKCLQQYKKKLLCKKAAKIRGNELDELVVNAFWSSWSRRDVIAIDVYTEIFTGHDNVTVTSKSHIIAVCMFDATFKSAQQGAISAEHSDIEVVMIVGNNHTARSINSDTNRIIGGTSTADGAHKCSSIAVHLTMKQLPLILLVITIVPVIIKICT